MTTPRRIEWLGTYFVPNNEKKAEVARLQIEDSLFTSAMGGPLSEQAEPGTWKVVLDIGCGIGDWAAEVGTRYPGLAVTAIDINRDLIESARTRARGGNKPGNVTYQVMDALEPLTFAEKSFDLVNMRLGSSFVRTWDWPALLQEILRVLRPGGVVRLTEAELAQQGSSPAHAHCFELYLNAAFNSGRLFERASTGLTAHLPRLLRHYGLQNVQSIVYPFTFKTGTPGGKTYYAYIQHCQTILPFIQKWGSASQDVETIFQQSLDEIQHKGFHTTWNVHTVWGHK